MTIEFLSICQDFFQSCLGFQFKDYHQWHLNQDYNILILSGGDTLCQKIQHCTFSYNYLFSRLSLLLHCEVLNEPGHLLFILVFMISNTPINIQLIVSTCLKYMLNNEYSIYIYTFKKQISNKIRTNKLPPVLCTLDIG